MSKKTEYLTVKDYSVSNEEFQLLYNDTFDMLETFPQPSLENLPEYYNSDNYISHSDSTRNIFEKAYHVIRSITLKRKVKLINKYHSEKKNLLDIGCGTGDFLIAAKKKGWSISGIEPNTKARTIANSKTDNVVFGTEYLLKFKEQRFDVITLWHVFEHLHDIEAQITIFKTLLKSQGTLIIAIPNFKSYDAKYYKNYWAAYDVPRHLWHFSQNSIYRLFERHEMKIENVFPLKYDAYYVSLLSEKYKLGWMNIFNAFRIGFISNFKAKRSGEYSSLVYIIQNAN